MTAEAPLGLDSRTSTGRILVAHPDNAAEFWQLPGLTQEYILLRDYAAGKRDEIARLRPDFEMSRPLEPDEVRVADWTYEITRREVPITPPISETDDGLFSLIHHSVYSMSKNELAGVLERERQRAIEFSPGLFAPAEPIGRFTAARRYRAILEAKIASEDVQRDKGKLAA